MFDGDKKNPNVLYEDHKDSVNDTKMNAEFEVLATCKGEVILGNSLSAVVGDEFSGVLGFTEFLHIIGLFDFTLGGTVAGRVGPEWLIGTTRTEARLADDRLNTMENNITANGNRIRGVGNEVHGQRMAIAGLQNRVTATETSIAADTQRIQALETLCSAENIQMAVDCVSTLFQRTDALMRACVMLAQHTGMTGQHTQMNGQATALSGADTNINAITTII